VQSSEAVASKSVRKGLNLISNILRKALSVKGNPPKKIKAKLANLYLENLTNCSSKNVMIKGRNNNTKIPSSSNSKLITDNHSHTRNIKKNKISDKLCFKIKNLQNINTTNKENINIQCK
jgi:hypothetical protein